MRYVFHLWLHIYASDNDFKIRRGETTFEKYNKFVKFAHAHIIVDCNQSIGNRFISNLEREKNALFILSLSVNKSGAGADVDAGNGIEIGYLFI